MFKVFRITPQNKLNNIKFILSILCCFIVYASFFFTFARYKFNEYVYNVSLIDVLVSKGFNVNNTIVYVPIFMRIIILLNLIFLSLGLLMIIFEKYKNASLLLILSSLFPIIILSSSNLVHNNAAISNINNFSVSYYMPIFLNLIFSIIASIFSKWMLGGEALGESIFKIFSLVSIGAVIIISLYILISGIPAIYHVGLFNFLFKPEWSPKDNEFGILYLILSSIVATICSVILGVPIGILTAVFLSESKENFFTKAVRSCVQLLAGIPSVVYGFFGMLVIVPLIRNLFYGYTIGDSLLAVIIILSIMILPTIVSVSENSLRTVPQSYKEASLALGATSTKTIFKVIIPAAKSGLLSSVILGVGRAIGETMAIIMVAGNVVNMPKFLSPVRLLTTGIVLEMSYSSGLHRQVLFAIGLILFIFIMIVNLTFLHISKKGDTLDEK